MFANAKRIVWPICVSFAEVGVILVSANRLGAKLTFGLFAGTALIGLLLQAGRWTKRFKLLSEESSRLVAVMDAKTNNRRNWEKLPEFERGVDLENATGTSIISVTTTDANGNSDYIRDEKGQVLKSKLNEPLLQQIASATGGFYLPLRGANTIDTLYDRGLSVMPKTEGKERSLRHYHEQFWWALVPATRIC